jgi:transposase
MTAAKENAHCPCLKYVDLFQTSIKLKKEHMANLEAFQLSGAVRRNRYFSEDFKKRKVEELDRKLISMAELCRTYQVSSSAVYKWIFKYSLMKKKGVRMVVETDSDTTRLKALQDYVAQLEQLVGQKQFEIDFLKKQMELTSAQYGIDFKKKLSGKQSSGSGDSAKNTSTK